MSQQTKKSTHKFDEYESGPRPPVPGEESNASKMTTEGGAAAAAAASSSSTSSLLLLSSAISNAATNQSTQLQPQPHSSSQSPQPSSADSFVTRITRWQQNFEYLLGDTEGANLLLAFVQEECGEDSKQFKQLRFYFACKGIKSYENDMKKMRTLTRLIR